VGRLFCGRELSTHFHPGSCHGVVRLRDRRPRGNSPGGAACCPCGPSRGQLREPESCPPSSANGAQLVNNHFRSCASSQTLWLDPETPSAVNLATEAELVEQRRTVRGALERIAPEPPHPAAYARRGHEPARDCSRVGFPPKTSARGKCAPSAKSRRIAKLSEEGQTPLSTETAADECDQIKRDEVVERYLTGRRSQERDPSRSIILPRAVLCSIAGHRFAGRAFCFRHGPSDARSQIQRWRWRAAIYGPVVIRLLGIAGVKPVYRRPHRQPNYAAGSASPSCERARSTRPLHARGSSRPQTNHAKFAWR